MFVFNPYYLGCYQSCGDIYVPILAPAELIYLFVLRNGTVIKYPLEFEVNEVITIPLEYLPFGNDVTFFLRDDNGDRLIHSYLGSDYDGFTVNVFQSFGNRDTGWCGCDEGFIP